MARAPNLLCPSHTAGPGARLLGVVQADGKVHYLGRAPVVDASFLEAARAGRAPEARFRFAQSCKAEACANWTGSRCAVAAAVASAGLSGELPTCGIRAQCRWFAEQAGAACRGCSSVVRGAAHLG